MSIRRYRGETDVAPLQTFNAEAIAKTDGCGYLHPGDIAHRLFNGNKLFDAADVLSIWEEAGSVIAWVLASRRHAGSEAQVRPDRRDPGFERTVLEHAESETLRLMRRDGIERSRLGEGSSDATC